MSSEARQLSDETREIAALWCVKLSDGHLNPSDQRAFQMWLDSDPRHPPLFERTVVAWSAIEDQGAQPEMLRMRGAALDNLHHLGRRRWQAAPARAWRQAAALAACLLLFIATGLWWHYAPTTYATGTGERRVVALADGSSLSLDADTRVEVRYMGDRRELWLDRGRAKFSVAKDALRPFTVRAANRIVVATGTQFSVEKLGKEVRVVLYEGHVALLDATTPKPRALEVGPQRVPAEKALQPGRQLIIPDSSSVGHVVAIDPGRSLGWEAGLLEFADEPLGDAVERLNRYGTRVRVAPEAASIPISGQVQGGDADAFVEGVTAVFPIRATRDPDGSILLQAK